MEYFENWPYFAWAAGAATTFYLVTAFATSHLHPDKKAHLSLWLQGDYESTWANQFCTMFDRIFGENHIRLRCMALSAIASVLAVLALWLLFDRILGLISLRADTGLSLTQALLLGAAINIIPDYISLYETRWLLKQFERIRNPLGQLAILIIDAAVTGLIIFAGIKAYLWITGAPQISAVEMMALFSIYAIFFYSTFLTSIWAWAFCLSSWTSRLSARLRNWTDVQQSPGRTLALFGAVFVLLGTLATKPLVTVDEDGQTFFDGRLCSYFPAEACSPLLRMSKSVDRNLNILNRICPKFTETCVSLYEERAGVTPLDLAKMLRQSCLAGDGRHCTLLGRMYQAPIKLEQDYDWSATLFEMACNNGSMAGCNWLAWQYRQGKGLEKNIPKALELVTKSCEAGNAGGCGDLGLIYEKYLGKNSDLDRAFISFEKGCNLGSATACSSLGEYFRTGTGTQPDIKKANELFRQSCEREVARSCTSLGYSYERAEGVPQSYTDALHLYQKGCNLGNITGCVNLGIMHQTGRGTDPDYKVAAQLYSKACTANNAKGCAGLAALHEKGLGFTKNKRRAIGLYQIACNLKYDLACDRLKGLNAD